MRMSIDDPGAIHYQVFCDGVFLKYCIAADEEAGTATVYVPNSDGKRLVTVGTSE